MKYIIISLFLVGCVSNIDKKCPEGTFLYLSPASEGFDIHCLKELKDE